MGLQNLVHHFNQNVHGLPAEERALLGALAARCQSVPEGDLGHVLGGDGTSGFPDPAPNMGWETEY